MLITLLLLLVFTIYSSSQPVWAATLTLSNVPQTVTWNQEFSVDVYLEINAPGTNYYLRPCFYRSGSTAYFGCVKVGENWICDSQADKTSYFPITTNDQGVWQGQITVLTGNDEAGEFNFKIRRYTAGGNSFDSNPVFVTVESPILTPTPIISPTLIPTASPTVISSPTPTVTVTQDYDNIFLSEVLVNPQSGSEWVELYNGNDFSVELVDWSIDDLAAGGSSAKKFSLTIAPGNYQIVSFSGAIFNNSGDEVRLINSLGEEKDHFSYSSSTTGQSWGLTAGEWCLQEPSPGQANFACLALPTTPTPIPAAVLPTESPSSSSGQVASAKFSPLPQTVNQEMKSYLLTGGADNQLSTVERINFSSGSFWLPEWLLAAGGSLNLAVGSIRLIKRKSIAN